MPEKRRRANRSDDFQPGLLDHAQKHLAVVKHGMLWRLQAGPPIAVEPEGERVEPWNLNHERAQTTSVVPGRFEVCVKDRNRVRGNAT